MSDDPALVIYYVYDTENAAYEAHRADTLRFYSSHADVQEACDAANEAEGKRKMRAHDARARAWRRAKLEWDTLAKAGLRHGEYQVRGPIPPQSSSSTRFKVGKVAVR